MLHISEYVERNVVFTGAKRVGLTYVPVVSLNLLASNKVPDAGHPVCEQGKHGHE